MSWEQRLRELVLAGGAVAATACTGNSGSTSDASPSQDTSPSDDASPSQDAAPLDAEPDVVLNNFCCNVNPDPCCGYLHCGGPLTPECSQEMSCEADGGTWNPLKYSVPDGRVVDVGCSRAQDAAPPQDAAPLDAQPDAVGNDFDGSFCCNANPDPCCRYLHCGGPLTSVCSQEMSCEAEGGTWNSGTNVGCLVSQDAGPRDAAGTDAGGDAHD